MYTRIVDTVKGKFDEVTGIKKCLINMAMESKFSSMRKDGNCNGGIYDTLIFNKVKEGFGGRVKIMVSGGAPIKTETAEFMKAIMCCPLIEGYGQT